MSIDENKSLRDHLVYLLRGGGAHVSFDNFIADFPTELCGRKINGLPYTPWQVVEHMRIAQSDILEFSRDAAHKSPEFPDGYWPKESGKAELWAETVARFRADLSQMEDLVASPNIDLYARIPHGEGQTILREALLVADHNAYHLGALLIMGRILKAG